ncbi:L-threonylcarbamoyladenylate synthase [Neochlamydia sp. EPS4]|uniref:L-threonylcarbamoyladenylate synthase n=1 Tax=Neochlamydia sp. EPS4 TaxID=1478175 RepID=UPI0005D1143E|nr:L-threonylcarbamoyladenylate synthase [Neochlamydia sp. EPS4]
MRISLKEAAHRLNTGEVVGVPTETVYGLAASLNHLQAIEHIYTLKGRPSNNPLIIHVAELNEVLSYQQGNISDLEILAQVFWPGPMTIVLPVKCRLIPAKARANLPTAAFRIPRHPLALELLKQTGPLVMPSANLSGSPSSTRIEHVEHDFGKAFPVLDGGTCQKGLESTILTYRNGYWQIIRQGALTAEDFCSSLGYLPMFQQQNSEKPLCPGGMYRHYAPQAKLKLVQSFKNIVEGVIIGFSDRHYPAGCKVFALGPLAEPELAASNLYAVLRQLDQEKYQEAYVDVNFLKRGILATLSERLHRASEKPSEKY